MAVVLLCCTFGVLLGATPTHAQATGGGPTGTASLDVGDVDDLTITTSVDGPTGVTTPVNKDATFTATASAGTPKFVGVTPGWTIVAGSVTYHWYIAGAAPGTQSAAARSAAAPGAPPAAPPANPPPTLGITYSPANTATTTVTIPGGSPARTDGYVVTITCAVRYEALGPDGKQPGYLESSVSKTIPVYVIGGPISGENDIYWFCDSSSYGDWGHLSAASGQPDGTTYSWSLTGTGAQFLAGTTSTKATYCGAGSGSHHPGDEKATVTYSLNNVTAASDPWPITVHAPMTFAIMGRTPAAKYAYGFDGQTLTFQVLDSLGYLYSPDKHKAYWSESWKQFGPNGGGQPGDYGGGPLDGQSQGVDGFSSPTGLNAPSNPADPYGDRIWGPLTHKYSITDIGGTGGDIGCAIQTYTDVYYYTYQMTGNGFAPKPSTP